jgi:hypothetical protein
MELKMEIKAQLQVVKAAIIAATPQLAGDDLTFDHDYGGFCWSVKDEDTYFGYVNCIVYPHKVEWIYQSDEPRLNPCSVVYFVHTFYADV